MSPANMSTLQLNTYLGPYFLTKLIAIGGMAEIYLATTQGLAGFEKQLALKVIHPDYADDDRFVQMLVDEAKIAVSLNHPNIAQTFDLGKISNCYFISMEFVDGTDYFQMLKTISDMGSEIPLEAAVLIAHEVLSGLDYAHKKCDENGRPLRIIHRDISPQNILISRYGEVKIVDFGIAKAANLSTRTRAGVIKGKLVYMSPEQAWGDTVDHRTDVFSAGIVLYEALIGESLYNEKSPVKLLEMVRRADIRPPSARRLEIPRELDAIIMKALSSRPNDRFQTAGEFADALAEFLHGHASDYTTPHLAALVEAVKAGEVPKRQQKKTVPSAPEGMMAREDFQVQRHSVIFTEDEIRDRPDLDTRRIRSGGMAAVAKGAKVERRGKLVVEASPTGEGTGTPYLLGDEFVIGRAGDLRLGDARVSRRHARVVKRDGEFVLEDLGSANGTYLNDIQVTDPRALQTGDLIRLGPFEIRFLLEDLPEVPAPEEMAPDAPEQTPTPEPEPQREIVIPAAHLAPPPVVRGRPILPLPLPPPMMDREEEEEEPTNEPRVPGPSAADPNRLGVPVVPLLGVPLPVPVPAEPEVGPEDGATVLLRVGGENLSLAVGERLALRHAISVGEVSLEGIGAFVVRRADGYWVEPTVGAGGVVHNGRRLSEPTQLNSGDTLVVGPVEMEFILG
jgi:serine/threonine protein kinase